MKKFSPLTILCLIFFLTQTSCRKQGCTDLTADNSDLEAKKDNGSCTYSAPAFFGNYHVEDIVVDTFFNDTVNLSYNIKIIESFGNSVLITNFYNSDTVGAIIRKGLINDIAYHGIKQISLNGSGTCVGDTIKWNYNINNGDRLVTGTCVRQ